MFNDDGFCIIINLERNCQRIRSKFDEVIYMTDNKTKKPLKFNMTIHYGKKNVTHCNEQIYIVLILNFYILQEEIQISNIVLRAMFIIFVLKSMIKQLFDLVYGFFHLKCIIKQLLDSVFVVFKIINVSVRVISLG